MSNNFFEVLRPGINTTFQDKGRFGMQHLGVASSGCMDDKSFLIANSLVSNNENEVLKNLQNNIYEVVYLIGVDNLNFDKKKEFVIYQGSHGDKGADLADIILPGAAFTEQDGHYTNLEGVIQKAYKASYPPGEAKEDWLIINELSNYLSAKNIYETKESLEKSMFNYLNLHNSKVSTSNKINNNFVKEKIIIKDIDYYYSNAIARASKTMSECKNEKINLKSTGTEG